MSASIDSLYYYCERTSDSLWAEPVNAITNLGFLLAALLLIRQFRHHHLSPLKSLDIILLIILLFAIGVGSFLWHTLASPWTQLADKIPILLFISLYLLSFLRRIAGAKLGYILLWFMLYHAANTGLQAMLPTDTLNGSIFYLPTLASLLIMGIYLKQTHHHAAHNLLLAGGLFSISLVFRTMDFVLCSIWSIGTHFLWHLINAWVLYLLVMALIINQQIISQHRKIQSPQRN